MATPSTRPFQALPDPVPGRAPLASVEAWIDTDGWVDGKPPADPSALRFHTVLTVRNAPGGNAIELDMLRLSVESLESIAQACQEAAQMIRRAT